MNRYRSLIREGLWDNNVIFVQLLALCPLLAVTSTATNGLGMGLATTAVMASTGLAVSLLRQFIPAAVRIPVFVLLIAGIVTLVDMALNAWLHDLHKVLGLFIPLIVTNCVILGRAESYASRNGPLSSLLDGVCMGVGFTWAMVLLGASREVLGSGTLFANARLLLGEGFAFLELTLIPDYGGILLLVLPPGAFLMLGLLLAAKRFLESQARRRRGLSPQVPVSDCGGCGVSSVCHTASQE